jgi:hypothetical protein
MRDYGPGRPLVFNHIPKTAGTMLADSLRSVLQPTRPVQVLDQALFGAYDDIESLSPAARRTVVLSPQELPADADFVTGHVSPGTTLPRFPEADHLTVLRVPQVRLLSQFLHSRSVGELDIRHWGGTAEAFRAGWAPLGRYLQDAMVATTVDNTMTRFLAYPHPALARAAFIDESADDELVEAVLERLDRFAFVAVAENPAFMDDLAAWLGAPLPRSRDNERRSVPARRRPDLAAELDPAARELLDHRTRIDARIWAHVAARVLPAVDTDELLRTTVQRTVDHYRQVLAEPDTRPPVRRLAEAVYEAGVRTRLIRRASASR